jgi:uncharacterized membrane protein YgcG
VKRKIFTLLFAAVLAVFAAVPVLAFEDYGHIYDGTGRFDRTSLSSLSGDKLTALSDRYAIEARVDIVTDLEGRSISEYARLFYDQYGYGYGDTDDGILLMVQLRPDDDGFAFGDYEVCYGGEAETIFNGDFRDTLETALDIHFSPESWTGDFASDNEACVAGLTAFADVLDNVLGTVLEPAAPTAAESFFGDDTGRLSEEELASLNEKALEISNLYQCGVYGLIVEDYREYDQESVYDAAKALYKEKEFGLGGDRDGVFLLLSMADRDYALIAHGEKGNGAFTDYGKDELSGEFLGDFGKDDWYGGFSSYLSGADRFLALYDEGEPYDVGSSAGSKAASFLLKLFLIAVVPAAAALVICLFLRRSMKTAVKAVSARDYLADSGIRFTCREDNFSHITEVITKLPEASSSSGGTTVDSGGFSGKSGKF